jgi:hypothetical protein
MKRTSDARNAGSISAAEWRARLYAGTISAAEWRARHLPGRPSKIAGDPEVRQFVNAAFKTMTFVEIAAACLVRFGPERAPTKSSVHRYWLAVRSRHRSA